MENKKKKVPAKSIAIEANKTSSYQRWRWNIGLGDENKSAKHSGGRTAHPQHSAIAFLFREKLRDIKQAKRNGENGGVGMQIVESYFTISNYVVEKLNF